MMPLLPSPWIAYALAVISGFFFGFVLERAGFGSSRKLAAQFYFKDMTVLKVMFTAIVTAMLGLTLLMSVGLVNFDNIYVNPTYLLPQTLGGLIFGVGFVVGGYCPGTSMVAAVTGKLDAVGFLLGTAGGVLVYSAVFPLIEGFATQGGERLLLTDWLGLPHGVVAVLVTLMALGMFAGGEYLERRFGRKAIAAAPPAQPEDRTEVLGGAPS
jgi:uncharacterized membrane protein YedE/YeeE